MRGDVIMTRVDAIMDIRCGMGVMMSFQGRFTSYRIILRVDPRTYNGEGKYAKVECVVEDTRFNRVYTIRHLTTKQVVAFIKRWYPRHLTDGFKDTESPTFWEQAA